MNILDPQGPVAAADKAILIDSIAIMLAIVLPTIAAIFAFAYHFRQSNGRASYLPNFAHSGRIELVVWSIPTLTVILLGGVAWIGSHQLDPARPVEGTGAGVTVPVVSPLHLQLTSGSVMNVFFVPSLGSMIYTMNGMVTRLELRADGVGDLQGLSAMLSGDGFSDMLFDVHVVSQPQFSEWASGVAKNGKTLDRK